MLRASCFVLPNIIIICGPTCVGKTRVAVELAHRFNGEMVSADSQAVWRGLNIGTAKPRPEELDGVPCHLIDVAEPNETFDVARYVRLADEAIADIMSRGRIPFVVGGTGLYIRALCHGLAEAPPRDSEYRAYLNDIKNTPHPLPSPQGGEGVQLVPSPLRGEGGVRGTPYLYQMLAEKDPATAARLKPNDTTRIIRALEVLHTTGRSISDIQNIHKFKEVRYKTLKIGLTVDRAELYRWIDARVDKMIADGLVEEVVELVKKYGPDAHALQAVGYKEIANPPSPPLLKGGEGGIINLIKLNTRHLAKRQLTWFKRDKEIVWFRPEDVDEMVGYMSSKSQNLSFKHFEL